MTASQSQKPCRTPSYSHPTAATFRQMLRPNRPAGLRARTRCEKKPPTDSRDRVPLFPAGLPFAVSARARIGLFPLRNRACFVVVHLFVHTNAVRANDRGCAARLVAVISDALIDPLEVVGVHLLGGCGIGRDQSSE